MRSVNVVLFTMILTIGILLFACNEANDTEGMNERVENALDDMDRDKGEVRKELMELRRDIDARAIAIEEDLRLKELDEETRNEKEQALNELQENRNRVQQALTELENADRSSWHDVRLRSKDLTRAVDRWFERQAEKEDLRNWNT